jgi:hypothetical protein
LKVLSQSITKNPEIEFDIPYPTFVAISIYDVFGNKVKTLFSKHIPSGNYQIGNVAESIPSGVYYTELKTPAVRIVKPMVITR